MNLDPSTITMIGGGLFAFVILALFWPEGDSEIKKRMARVSGQAPEHHKDTAPHQTLKRSTSDSSIPFLDRMIKSYMPNPDKLRARLAQTGRKISLGSYLLTNVIMIGIIFVVCNRIWGLERPTAFMLAIAAGLYLPHAYIGRLGNKQLAKFLASFPEAIDTICRGLRSGLPVTESIAAVGREMPDPIGVEFRRISDGVKMGRPLEDAMWEVAKRINCPEFRFFIISMAIQRETGGNLGETLSNLSDLLRRRRQLRLKIKAMSSEAKASAAIIGSLPFIMFGLLFVVNPEYIMTLLTTPKGKFMLGFAASMMGVGVMVMKKMVNFEL